LDKFCFRTVGFCWIQIFFGFSMDAGRLMRDQSASGTKVKSPIAVRNGGFALF